MFEKIMSNKEVIMRIVEENPAIDCIALMGDKLLIGVVQGKEYIVTRNIEHEMVSAGLDFATGWEVTISRYPVMVVRSKQWVFDKEVAFTLL